MASDVRVLLVDDDSMDVMAVQRAFAKAQLSNPLIVAKDGSRALNILRGEDTNRPLERPYVVLLDLNMPTMNGFEFLDELRQDPGLRGTVVFVLSTSAHDQDRTRAYSHNVAGYILKSKLGENYRALTTMLSAYWDLVELP